MDDDTPFFETGSQDGGTVRLSRNDLLEGLADAEAVFSKPCSEDLAREARRKWWLCAAGLLIHHDDNPSRPPPSGLMSDLIRISVELANGILPPLVVSQPLAKGRRAEPMHLYGAKSSAVAYVRAALAGIVDDPDPVGTVCERFKISERRTVQRWTKNARYTKTDLGAITAEQFVSDLNVAAEVYPTVGASHEAIRARNTKRPRRGK
ncbi:MAG: hypothetical protein KJS97_01650 [Alphaproteobacteria bacterium]|nr:hypothetical protein [Alphaproteobacteria bacterium]